MLNLGNILLDRDVVRSNLVDEKRCLLRNRKQKLATVPAHVEELRYFIPTSS